MYHANKILYMLITELASLVYFIDEQKTTCDIIFNKFMKNMKIILQM